MKGILKSFFFLLLSWRSGLRNRASILMYHSVGNNDAFFTVRPEEFEKQIAYIRNSGRYQALTLSALVNKMTRQEDISGTVVVTFDDGYTDNYVSAFPILKKYNIPCTIFVPSDLIGTELTTSAGITLPLLTPTMMNEMRASGLVEFMPHGKTHRTFTTLSDAEATQEIEGSKQALEALTQRSADIFAFPKGATTPAALAALASAGYLAAVTVAEGTVGPQDNIYLLRRNSIDSSTSFWQFKGKISTAIDRYVACKNIFRYAKKHTAQN